MNNPAIGFSQQPYYIDILFEGTTSSSFGFSYHGTGSTDQRMKGIDGTILTYSLSNGLDFTTTGSSGLTINYPIPISGVARIYMKDAFSNVRSIRLTKSTGASGNRDNIFKIENLETFFKPFKKLYSLDISIYASGNANLQPIMNGDLAKLPKSVERIRLSNTDVKEGLFLNIDSYNSNYQLKFIQQLAQYNVSSNNINIYGDLKNLPPLLTYFDVRRVLSSAVITYSGSKVFPSSFEKFYLEKNLLTSEIDLLLNDMASSITTAIGEKTIYLRGTRTSASDSAVAYLQSLGFTVTITA